MNLFCMQREIFANRLSTLTWCREKKLLPFPDEVKCSFCNSIASFEDDEGYSAGRFRCRKRVGSHKLSTKKGTIRREFEQSGSKNTFFFNSKMGIEKTLVLTYCWANNFNYEQTTEICHSIKEQEEQRLSSETISDWFSYLREVSLAALDNLYAQNGQIGGIGHIVEIDESKFGKRKYNRGKRVEGSWLLGMIDLGTAENPSPEGNFRLEICPENKRDAETLIPLIQKHVAPGTTIYSDCWKAYGGLQELNYHHLTVNHSINFKDPETGVHTNHIESNWRPLKRSLQGTQKSNLADHLCKFLWRREIKKKKGNFFNNLLEDISKIDWSEFSELTESNSQPTNNKRNDLSDKENDDPAPKKRFNRQQVYENLLF